MKLLIIGQINKVGGVSIHVNRLIEHLNLSNFNHDLFDLGYFDIRILCLKIFKAKVIHLHTSHSIFRLLIVILSRILNKKIIFTFHGNLGRYSITRNLIDKISLSLAHFPILINNESYIRALKINKNSLFIGAFLPPLLPTLPLPEKLKTELEGFKKEKLSLFCTNAYDMSYDKNNVEIYQILNLVLIFNNLPEYGLIICNPNGSYQKYFEHNNITLKDNIFLISKNLSFIKIIELSDCLLRITSTDGDSISIKEALWIGKPVIASNVVSRPEQVILTSLSSFEIKEKIINLNTTSRIDFSQDNFKDLRDLYNKF